MGHIRDLPKSDKGTIDVENGFKAVYVIPKAKEKVVNDIVKRSKKADEVILATDPDREGEAIAWHIAEAADLKDPKRVTFNEITKDAVLSAMEEPGEIDTNLRTSQEARRVLDRLFGYTLSKLIWTKVRYGLSAGRVQSPALRILLEREREIRAFEPVTYYQLGAVMKRSGGEEYITEGEKTFENLKEVEEILGYAKRKEWEIAAVKKTSVQRKPKPPFITSSLQQSANSAFGWSPSQTMRVAQKLYEAGAITYMRTDSTTLSKSAQDAIRGKVVEEYGEKMYQETFYRRKSKNAQEAHEAIRPSNPASSVVGGCADEKKLYDLIYRRTLSSQMVPASVVRTVVRFECGTSFAFVVRGSVIKEAGWLRCNTAARGEEVELPEFKEGEKFSCVDVTSQEKQTAPPPRYSEAGLVKELEERGIGRPSTYASIIATLIARNYVEKQQRSLVPTDLGDVVSTFVEDHFSNYISDTFTAEMEDQLDEIADGKMRYEDVLGGFFFSFRDSVDSKKDVAKLTSLGDAEGFECPKCSGGMEYKLSKTGTFMSCKKFPDCTGSRTREGEEIKEPEPIGKECPECGEPLVRRTGRYGDFISCSAYPKCKHIEGDPEEEAKRDTGVKCTECKEGSMVERRGRFGPFFSCSRYPKCKFAIKARPTGEKCQECGSLMMEGTKTIPTRCCVKTCPMHNPHKL